jgi:mRNA interferase MazF
MIYKTFDIIVVPFPFADTQTKKQRPALILSSFNNFGKLTMHSLAVMITTIKQYSWSLDVKILDYKKSGLLKPSIIRMKLFTIDHRLIKRKIGKLSLQDQESFIKSFNRLLEQD